MRKRSLIALIVLASGCATPIAPAGWARRQAPSAGTPAQPWLTTQGRCVVDTPLARLSCRLVVRHRGPDALQLTLLADEGPVLLAGAINAGQAHVDRVHPDLAERAPLLLALAAAAWGPLPSEAPTWQDGHWAYVSATRTVHVGGDPLLPRQVESDGLTFVIGDYRLTPAGLLARRASLLARGIEVTLTLGPDVDDSLRALPSTPASPTL